MVFIFKEISTGKELCLGFNGTYFIGRRKKNGNQIVLDDKTVSKSHAALHVKDGIATITDLNSKRGTFLNKVKISRKMELRDGDVIFFGIQDCKYCFLDPKWETQIDMNDISPEKIVIRKTLDALGVKYYEFFNDDSTHYTTEKVTLWSLKNKSFLTCLIDRKSIVTLKFWIDVLEKTKLAEEIPKSKDYMPKVDKYLELQGVTNINSNLARRFLLDDKIVIFFDKKSMEEVSGLIIKCGGQTILYEKTNDFIEKLRYIAGLDYILVKNEMNIKALLEMQRLGKALKQNKNNVCIAAPNDILINILKVSFENFASIKKVLSGPNKIYTKAKQTNEVIISDDSSEGEIRESCVAAEAVLLEQQEIPTICSIDQTWNNINVTISKSINFHEIRTSRSIRHTNNRLVINPIQNIKHGNGSIKSDHLDFTNVNDHHTSINLRRNKNNFISHFNLSSAKHVIAMSSKNGNERMIINPLALPSIRPNRIDENANKRKSNEDIEYWKKKYKRIEITEMY